MYTEVNLRAIKAEIVHVLMLNKLLCFGYHTCIEDLCTMSILQLCSHQWLAHYEETEFLDFFLTLIYFTSLREQDEAYINSSQWSALVGLESAYTRM